MPARRRDRPAWSILHPIRCISSPPAHGSAPCRRSSWCCSRTGAERRRRKLGSPWTMLLLHDDFTVFTWRSVLLALDPSSAGLTGIERDAFPTPEGNWNIMNLNIPAADIWTARVIIDAGGAPIVLDAPIVITQCSNEC